MADFNAGLLAEPQEAHGGFGAFVRSRTPDRVGLEGWRAIDRAERHEGARQGRPRRKLTRVGDMLDVAATGSPPPREWRDLARIPGRGPRSVRRIERSRSRVD
jgi:ferredoxin--NADP+ reductase